MLVNIRFDYKKGNMTVAQHDDMHMGSNYVGIEDKQYASRSTVLTEVINKYRERWHKFHRHCSKELHTKT